MIAIYSYGGTPPPPRPELGVSGWLCGVGRIKYIQTRISIIYKSFIQTCQFLHIAIYN